MIVSDRSLRRFLEDGTILVEPLEDYQIQPASIDLRLGNHFLKIDENRVQAIDLGRELEYIEIRRSEIIIPPNSFLLAVTRERIRLPGNITAFVEGRSSIGRIGLFIQNAGWVDPGFDGTITLELYNANRLPIRLESGRRICQIVFALMDGPAAAPYAGKYQHQAGAVGSRVYLDSDAAGAAGAGPRSGAAERSGED
ncbi:MAG: dCTP deaminase [Spirochaetales bacterium]|nr:dCTP deaminase [Spirochaetales bacterium]